MTSTLDGSLSKRTRRLGPWALSSTSVALPKRRCTGGSNGSKVRISSKACRKSIPMRDPTGVCRPPQSRLDRSHGDRFRGRDRIHRRNGCRSTDPVVQRTLRMTLLHLIVSVFDPLDRSPVPVQVELVGNSTRLAAVTSGILLEAGEANGSYGPPTQPCS